MTELEKWKAVNAAKDLVELSEVMMSFEGGYIQGRSSLFNLPNMAKAVRNFNKDSDPCWLTRNYGIRQQALFLL